MYLHFYLVNLSIYDHFGKHRISMKTTISLVVVIMFLFSH